MSGPKTKSRAPISTGYGTPRIIRGKIIAVDKVKHTCTVAGELRNEMYEGIQFMPKYLNADGTGSFLTPEANSIVWLCFPSSERNPFILGAAAVPFQDSQSPDADPNDYRMNRPVLNEGDEMIASRDSGYIIMRKGGIVEIAASQMARTFYVPVDNIIQSFCENYKIETPGMKLSALARDEDESHGADTTPFEFKLEIKEFANDEIPMIDLRMGRIAAEDDTFIPFGGENGEIVARLVINQSYSVFVDKRGNVSTTVQGNKIESIVGAEAHYVDKNLIQRVKGLFRHHGKDRAVTLVGQDSLEVGGNRVTKISGSLQETVEGSVKRTVSGVLQEESSEVNRTVRGSVTEDIIGSLNQVVAGGVSKRIAENAEATVLGKAVVTVGNATAESAGLQVVLANGELQIVDVLGSIIFASGGLPNIAAAKITLQVDGTIELSTLLGVVKYQQNATGAKISTPVGEISVDNAGTVNLGPPGRGGVVTTLTHPVDYITGLPILGSSSVAAGGIPSPTPIPSTFVDT